MPSSRVFYGWVVAGVCFINVGISYGVWYSFTVFFVAVREDLRWDRASTALAFSLFALTHGLSAPLVGAVVERIGPRRMMLVGSVWLAMSLVASSLIDTTWQYYLTFGVLASIGVSATGTVPNYTAVTNWFVRRRGLAVGIATAGMGALSLFALVPFNQYMISALGWRSAYLVLALVVIGVLPALNVLLLRERPRDIDLPVGIVRMEKTDKTAIGKPSRAVVVGAPQRDWRPGQAVRTRAFWALCIGFLLASLASQTVLVHQVAYLVDIGYDQLVAAWAVGFVGLASTGAKVLWGAVSDRFTSEAAYTAGAGCALVGIATLFMMPGSTQEWPLIVFSVAFGAGYAVFSALNAPVAAELFPGRHFSVIYGLFTTAMNLGAALGPWLAGFLFDVRGSYYVAFVVAMGACVVSACSIWIAAPRSARRVARVEVPLRAGVGETQTGL